MERPDIETVIRILSDAYVSAHINRDFQYASGLAYALGASGITNEEWEALQQRKQAVLHQY